jgi:hypothetical protein
MAATSSKAGVAPFLTKEDNELKTESKSGHQQ